MTPKTTTGTRYMNVFGALLTALSAVALPGYSALAADLPAFSAEDVFEMEYANDPQVSPDGSRVAYVRSSMDIMTDRTRRSIWVIDVDGDNHRPLVSGSGALGSPRWSPSGDRLAYLSNSEGKTQLFVQWLKGGESAKVTTLSESPRSIVWSPDGKYIAFTRFVPAPPPTLAEMPAKPDGATWAEPATVIDRMTFRRDGGGYLPTGNNQVFVVPADGGTPLQMSRGNYPIGGSVSWVPGSQSIIYSSNRRDNVEYHPRQMDLFEASIATGNLTQVTDHAGAESNPAVSPNGRYLAYTSTADTRQGYNRSDLRVMDLSSGESRSLTAELDRSVSDVEWARDSKSLWISYDDAGMTRVAEVDLKGTLKQSDIVLGGTALGRPYTSGAFSVGGKGRLAFTLGRDDRPADLALMRPGKTPRVLTNLNDDLMGQRDMARVERITWASSHDAMDIEGWVMKPPGFNPEKQYPMILEIHGGPHSAYGPNFSTEAQLYAAAGYVVFYTNPRGSTSYGERFANTIDLAYPGYDYDDLMSGVDALIRQGFVDEAQLYVTGGSGGGVLTAWIVGKTNRFRAAVVAKPVINWASFVLTADLNYYFATTWFDAPPWEDYEGYWKRSPLSLVGNVSTPTMLLTGEADYRTPMSETEQYYQALKHRGVDTLMVRIPDASHSIYARPSNLIAKVNNILAWFERYKGNTSEDQDSAGE
jgi:dipeptidyl aminopeptidase/acylaminoacyl peptidase